MGQLILTDIMMLFTQQIKLFSQHIKAVIWFAMEMTTTRNLV